MALRDPSPVRWPVAPLPHPGQVVLGPPPSLPLPPLLCPTSWLTALGTQRTEVGKAWRGLGLRDLERARRLEEPGGARGA